MDIYFLDIEIIKKIDKKYFETHFPKRYSNSKRFLREEDRLRSVGAGILLSSILKIDEAQIKYNNFGKPYIENSTTFFNISHSKDYVVLAVNSSPVGIDIEFMNKNHLDISKKVFTNEELKWMDEDEINRFYQLWTIKESILKAVGKGISVPLKSFSVLNSIKNGYINIDEYRIYSKSEKVDNYTISVSSTNHFEMPKFQFLTEKDIIEN